MSFRDSWLPNIVCTAAVLTLTKQTWAPWVVNIVTKVRSRDVTKTLTGQTIHASLSATLGELISGEPPIGTRSNGLMAMRPALSPPKITSVTITTNPLTTISPGYYPATVDGTISVR